MQKLCGTMAVCFLLVSFPAAATPLPVVASFSILGDIAKTIGGDAVTVTTLVGPDGDAHSYQPTPADVKTITPAKLLIVNGLGFEGWMDRLVQAAGYKGRIVIASAGLAPRTALQDHEIVTDPHAWQDLGNGRRYAKTIATALKEALPDQAAAIDTRAAAYDAQLAAVDADIRKQIAAVPEAKRKIVTSHDAFGYFTAAYGVTFLAPEGFNTEAEPSAKAIAALHEQIKNEGIHTVFLENMSNARLLRQIAQDSGVAIGGTLYADALSGPQGAAPTYLGMFQNNVPQLVAAMQANGQP